MCSALLLYKLLKSLISYGAVNLLLPNTDLLLLVLSDCAYACYLLELLTLSSQSHTLYLCAETNVAYSTVSPLLVFMAIISVIISRLYTQIRLAKQAEIQALNKQIAGLTGSRQH